MRRHEGTDSGFTLVTFNGHGQILGMSRHIHIARFEDIKEIEAKVDAFKEEHTPDNELAPYPEGPII